MAAVCGQDIGAVLTAASIYVRAKNRSPSTIRSTVQRCRPHLVEVEEGRQIGEHLVPDPVPRLLPLVYLVDDVVRDLVILPDAENVVALDGGGVAHQEDAALALAHQEVGGVLARHGAKVPAERRQGCETICT